MIKKISARNLLGIAVFKESEVEARHMKNKKIDIKTEVEVMRTKLMDEQIHPLTV
jgi:hypothetical protein